MTPTLDPGTLRRVLTHDFRDALDDLMGDVPLEASDYTTMAVETLLRHLGRCESYLLMLRYNASKIEQCVAVRGMQNDIGPATYEAAQEAAATVQAQPSLWERLGRAPLSDDGGMP